MQEELFFFGSYPVFALYLRRLQRPSAGRMVYVKLSGWHFATMQRTEKKKKYMVEALHLALAVTRHAGMSPEP